MNWRMLVAVSACIALVGCGDGSGDESGTGGSARPEADAPAETVPLDSAQRGCDEDPRVVGCAENPAPGGTTFEDENNNALIRYVTGTVDVAPSGDPLNEHTYTATVTLEVTNLRDSDRDVAQFPWQVSIGLPGDTLDGCGLEPRDGTVGPGESIELTQVCSIDLGGDGSVDPENWSAYIYKDYPEADLRLEAAR